MLILFLKLADVSVVFNLAAHLLDGCLSVQPHPGLSLRGPNSITAVFSE